jgi:cell division protein FtsZ
MAMGKGSNPQNPVMEATKNALTNPLNDVDFTQAKGLLLSFRGGSDLGLGEYQEALTFISGKVKPDAPLVFGVSHAREKGSHVDLTLVAAGIELPRRGLFGRAR